MFLENVRTVFVFHFYAVSLPLLGDACQFKAAGACIVKHLSSFSPVDASLCYQCDCPAPLSACLLLPFFSPPLFLPFDSCHVSEAITPLLRLVLFISLWSWISLMPRVCACVCLHVFVPVIGHVGWVYVCLHVCASITVFVWACCVHDCQSNMSQQGFSYL